MMGRRKIFMLFLSAMAVSIIIMVIIYGVFIKDIDFSFNVKNPESAPSPIDALSPSNDEAAGNNSEVAANDEQDGSKTPAKIETPEVKAKEDAANTPNAGNTDEAASNEDEAITEVVPLEPQVSKTDKTQAHTDDAGDNGGNAAPEVVGDNGGSDASSLHYVYLDGFSSKDAAEQAIQQLQERSNLVAQPYVRQHHGQIILQFGVFSDKENAEVMAQQLRNQNVYVKID